MRHVVVSRSHLACGSHASNAATKRRDPDDDATRRRRLSHLGERRPERGERGGRKEVLADRARPLEVEHGVVPAGGDVHELARPLHALDHPHGAAARRGLQRGQLVDEPRATAAWRRVSGAAR